MTTLPVVWYAYTHPPGGAMADMPAVTAQTPLPAFDNDEPAKPADPVTPGAPTMPGHNPITNGALITSSAPAGTQTWMPAPPLGGGSFPNGGGACPVDTNLSVNIPTMSGQADYGNVAGDVEMT